MAPGGKRGNGMSTIETGGAAFPLYDHRGDGQLFMVEIGMTMRQYAAIHLRVPNSGADWLDDMIAEAREMDAAERAMQGLLAQSCGTALGSDPIHGAQYAYQMAVAMIAARKQNPSQ